MRCSARVPRAASPCLAIFLAIGASFPREAHADDLVRWDERWARFGVVEGIATGALGGAALLGGLVFEEPAKRWEGRNGFDEAVRDGLRGGRRARKTAATLSDGLFYGLAAYPLVIDAALVTWVVHGEGDVALQLALMDLLSLATSGTVALLAEHAGRARPYTRDCPDPDAYPACDGPGPNKSFPSGHTMAAFTGAGLVCAHHEQLPLYGRGTYAIVCGLAVAGAATSGVSRIVSDNHYATDVLAAAAVGLASGYVLPKVLHYGFAPSRHVSLVPWVTPEVAAIGVLGAF